MVTQWLPSRCCSNNWFLWPPNTEDAKHITATYMWSLLGQSPDSAYFDSDISPQQAPRSAQVITWSQIDKPTHRKNGFEWNFSVWSFQLQRLVPVMDLYHAQRASLNRLLRVAEHRADRLQIWIESENTPILRRKQLSFAVKHFEVLKIQPNQSHNN